MELLLYSKDPLKNLKVTRYSAFSILLLTPIAIYWIYMHKGVGISVLISVMVLITVVFEYYVAKVCVHEDDEGHLEAAYRNGMIANSFLQLLLCLGLLLVLGAVVGGLVSVIIICIGVLYKL